MKSVAKKQTLLINNSKRPATVKATHTKQHSNNQLKPRFAKQLQERNMKGIVSAKTTTTTTTTTTVTTDCIHPYSATSGDSKKKTANEPDSTLTTSISLCFPSNVFTSLRQTLKLST